MKNCNIVSLIFLFWMSATTTLAHTPDLEQLKTKLQQLEQMMQDLKKQIASAEANENIPQPPTSAKAVPPPKVPPPELPTTYIDELTRTREVANQDSDGAARLDAEDVDPSLRGFFRLPGTGTLIKFAGFVKTDLFVDANQAGGYYGAYVPSSFPSSSQPHTVNATVSMRASRFSTEFRQPVGDDASDTAKAYLEYDFFGNYDRTSLRLKYDRMHSDPGEAVDIYTKQCSVGVNVKQLAEMGATLANNGVNPTTHEKVMKATKVPFVLAAMTMAGLYDGSGGWAWHVGLPAKSGVGGAILAIVPGKGAIAVFAPPLDEKGNSVKAQQVITYVSRKLNYNLFSPNSVGLGVSRPKGGGE